MTQSAKRIVGVVVALLVCLSAAPVMAGFSVGGSFAAPGYGARPWGMAGAAIASGADEASVYWNPAMLALVDEHRLGLAYSNLIPGIEARQSYVAYAQSLKRGPTHEPGLEFAEHAVGAIYGNLFLELSDGQSYRENMLRIAYAYSPAYFVSVGVSFAGLQTSSDVQGFGSTGSALDVALRLGLSRNMTLGAVARNVLSQLGFEDGRSETLPRSYTLGLAYTGVNNLLLETDIETKFGGFSKFVLGAEYNVYRDVLAVRTGLQALTSGETRSILYLGAGVQVRNFRFDYAVDFDSDEAFDNTQRFSLGIGF